MITLTVNEIFNLARFAGIELNESHKPDEDEGEATISIGECPEKGLFDETDQVNRRYRLMAWLEEYPDEGFYGLGPEIEANAEVSEAGPLTPNTTQSEARPSLH